MKLFVWNEPFGFSYGSSCLYVVAEDEDAARKAAKTARVSKYGFSYEDGVAQIDRPLGAPTRVIEAPCAEIYFWSE